MTVTDPSVASAPDPVDDEVVVDAEVVAEDDAFVRLVQRLSCQSVDKHYDAYADIPWDDPAYAIDPDDVRFELSDTDPLGRTAWYQSQPSGVRSRIGLYRIVSSMKAGLQFENILKRGLLEHTFGLPNGDPTFRYAYHEVIEEAHHGLMFQEFVNRSPFDTPGLRWDMRFGAARVVKLGHRFPELFFMFVLGGEDPIDHVQREALRSDDPKHPLVELIMRHHVTEEARHLSFARHYLKRTVPDLGLVKRHVLGLLTPTILGVMAQIMLQAPADMIDRFAIPAEVVREAYVDNPDHRAATVVALRKVRRLARELGIVTPLSKPVWKALGIWDDDLA